MAGYISRNGEVAMENQAGVELRGRKAIAALSDDWSHLMGNRAESRDIGTFRIDIAGGPREGQALHAWARDVVKSAVGERSFAFAVEQREDNHRIEGVVVLRARNGERLTADVKAEGIVKARMVGQGASLGKAEFSFTGYGNGVEYGTARLRKMVEKFDGSVENNRGEMLADAKRAGDLVQLEWRGELHSRKPRDVMHLVMSARAGTDVQAFQAAAREFLATEFAHHRYVFSLHDPTRDPKAEQDGGKRPHVHVHAIIAMRSEDGERVETSIASFRRWREGLAEQARAHGIRMEMTDRREQASAPAFSRTQVRPVSRDGRTEHEGTSTFSEQRYVRKRHEAPTAARTDRSFFYTEKVHQQWSELARSAGNVEVEAFADKQISRLKTAFKRLNPQIHVSDLSSDSASPFRTELVRLSQLAEVDTMSAMTRSEFEAYEKRVETALFQAERVMPENQRVNFEEIAAAAREHVDVRREIMEQTAQAGGRTPEDTSARQPDDANRQWDKAVARHGLEAVEAGNDIMIEVQYYRERIELADDDEVRPDKASLQASLNFELARAAELGAAGNSYIREVSEVDEALRVALEAAERSLDRSRQKADGPDERDVAGGSAESVGRHLIPSDEIDKARTGDHRTGDTRRTDPANQHISRLDELEREAERNRDDYDR
ncbi:relaxase/mobilization nuclease domain-containing protein [Rhizobium sp. P32RR-XVIII]|uniref:relaxase/mobilization nuclease domain-containing protein n=1 Tax=Rhizobium sp. P32RR-XVIII TaxID=2726738 RepID=UPI001FF07544|nr:conjugal transfer protein TraA [Rhizobium sp. P32RR-XVIII]